AIPLYGKNLVSDDFRGAAINIFFENLTYDEYVDQNIDGKIEALIAANQGPESIHFTGAAHVTLAAIEMLRRDLYRFTPLAVVLVVVALWLSFWTVRGVVLPLVSVLMAVIWTLGFMVLAGKSLTLGTFVLPPLLLVIGSSYAIHVMARYYEQVERGTPADELVVQAFLRVWLPLSLSAFTVVVGFASLMGNRIPAIFELGLFAGLGATALLVTSLSFIPAALAKLQTTARTRRSGKLSPWLDRALNLVARKTFGRQRQVFAIAIGLGAISILAALLVRVDSNFLAYFRPDSPVRQDNEIVNRDIVGSNVFYLVVEGDTPALLKQWDVLKLVDDLQRLVESLPGVTSTLSVVDYLELFEMGLSKQAEGGDVLLDEHGNIMEQQVAKPFREDPKSLPPLFEILNANPGVFKAVVTPDYSRGNILVRTRFAGSREVEVLLAQIRAWARERFPPVIQVHPTGTLVLIAGTASD
ncbi:MAG: efflux RND transporter permease subunit, partial [Candidatus Binatia bacterium]